MKKQNKLAAYGKRAFIKHTLDKFVNLIKICRPQQWYKNTVIFLPLIFVMQLFNTSSFIKVLAGFFALSFVSSSNYIINDVYDRKNDLHHPEKRKRAVASGKVKIWEAITLAVLLLLLAVYISAKLSLLFLISTTFLFVFTQIYTFWLKNEVFADVLAISVNFVNRSVSGAFIINAFISPWLILCTFFLAMFLAVAKRQSDIAVLGKKAHRHKEVFRHYTPEITSALMIISTTALIMSYALYSFLRNQEILLVTLPFALYVIFRYFDHAKNGTEISRNPEKVYKDAKLILGITAWIILTIMLLYFNAIKDIIMRIL